MTTRTLFTFLLYNNMYPYEGKGVVPVEKNISVKYERLMFDIRSIRVFLKLEYTVISCT
jgi:hypothetical protein